LAELNESDRDAVILRFLQQRSFREVAQTLGTSEEAAKKRVSRALERLRGLLVRRGIAISAAALAVGLSQLPVMAAPAALSSGLAALALSTQAPTVSAGTALLNLLTTTKAKLAIVTGLVILGVTLLLWIGPRSDTTPMRSTMPKIKLASVMVD